MPMFINRAVLLAGALAFAVPTIAAPVQSGGKTFSAARMGDNIKAAASPLAIGWAYSVAVGGKVADADAGGAARTKTDGFRAYTPSQRQQIASVAKTVTALAILQLLDKLELPVSTPIGPYLPVRWKPGPNIAKLTFSDLLRHRSGIDTNAGNQFDGLIYTAVEKVVEKGTTFPLAPGVERKAKYDNMNYAVLRVLVAGLWAAAGANVETEAGAMESQLGDIAVGFTSRFAGKLNSYAYIAYLQKNVFLPIGVKNALCRDISPAQTLYYTKAGDTPGYKSMGTNDWTETCGSAGWYLSANDLANVLAHLQHTEKLLSAKTRQMMLDRNLGLKTSKTFGGPLYFHDGIVGTGNNSGAIACAIMLPFGIEASIVMNSEAKTPTFPCSLLRLAYEGAWR